MMNCTPIVVTRGNVDLTEILRSLKAIGKPVVYDNSKRRDLNVFGRFAAAQCCTTDLVFFQDDDVIISNPQEILKAWEPGKVVCNMPANFRPGYQGTDSLMGFGSCCEQALVSKTFLRYTEHFGVDALFYRECSRIFTMLNPCIWVDVAKTDLPYASDNDRMWRHPDHWKMRDEARRRAIFILESEAAKRSS